jgi:hypothetical protein
MEHLYHFACSGLRTLVMAWRDIKEDDFDDWYMRYKQAATLSDPTEKEDK